jgi:glycerol-3-phosphate dehydrogenase
LSGNHKIGCHKSYTKEEMLHSCKELKSQGLIGGFSFFDGQMDDYELGLWALEQAQKNHKLTVKENTEVERLCSSGLVVFNNQSQKYDRIINVTGPWAKSLLDKSLISSKHELDLVRGSHILIEKKIEHGYFLEVPNEKRIFFVLPYQNKTLIGTTEVRQKLSIDIKVDEAEIDYLINAYNSYFNLQISSADVVTSFTGLRPLIKKTENASKTTREYVIERDNRVLSVFGGKWTTSRQLAKKVARAIY